MSNIILTPIVSLFCSCVASALTFFMTKKKYNTEVDSQVIHNINEASATYKRTMEDTLELLNNKIETLQAENSTLKIQVNNLQMQMINLLNDICMEANCKLRKKNVENKIAPVAPKATKKGKKA